MKKLAPPKSIPEQPVFRGFDLDGMWRIPGYNRNLPHWRIDGATYFVTFRLADSIPKSVAQRWKNEHDVWLRSNNIDPAWESADVGRFRSALASVTRDERRKFERENTRQFMIELDKCHGSCVLERNQNNRTVADAIDHFHGKRAWIGDYVVMPNHVHLIIQPFPGIELEEWLYSVKRFSSGKIKKLEEEEMSSRDSHLWQRESFDRIIRDLNELTRIRRYIVQNPKKLRSGRYALKQKAWLDEFAERGEQ